MKIRVVILGSGTSQGVPVIACDCHVCKSRDPKDKRLRSSILLTIDGFNYVIDTGPDFRQQMLREKVKKLNGIIYTHEHKDHIAGMDDVRAFNFVQRDAADIYCNAAVEQALRREFHYVFDEDKYPGVPLIRIHHINKDQFILNGQIKVIPVEVMHYKMPVLGFRIGDFAYLTDVKTISDEEIRKLNGVKVLVVNALRRSLHVSHLNLDESLALIERLKPQQAFLTHISHLFDTHENIQKDLPEGVFPAYDGLTFEIGEDFQLISERDY